jgi:hypothetical protein
LKSLKKKKRKNEEDIIVWRLEKLGASQLIPPKP